MQNESDVSGLKRPCEGLFAIHYLLLASKLLKNAASQIAYSAYNGCLLSVVKRTGSIVCRSGDCQAMIRLKKLLYLFALATLWQVNVISLNLVG